MLFGVVALLLIMGVALFWGFQRIISNEQERISTDFSLLTRYMLEQETLLERLSKAHILEYTHTTRSSSKVFYPTDQPPLQGATLFQGISSPVETRFSMICDDLPSARSKVSGQPGSGATWRTCFPVSGYAHAFPPPFCW